MVSLEEKLHEDSGYACLVAHYDENHNIKPGCIKCLNCQEFIRPEDMDNECPARKEK